MPWLPRGGGVIPYIGGFQAIYSGIGSSNHRKLVYNRVLFSGIAKQTKL